MLTSTAFYSLEKAVNFILQRDADSPARLAELEGKLIAIAFTDLDLSMYWLFEHQRVRIVSECCEEPDAKIAGKLPAIAKLGLSQAKVAKDLTVSGDLSIIEKLKTLFASLDIDWEAQIAVLTGDAPAYAIGKTLRAATQFFKQAGKSVGRNTKDYLEHEAQILPSRRQFTDLSDDIRELNRKIERLSARVRRLVYTN